MFLTNDIAAANESIEKLIQGNSIGIVKGSLLLACFHEISLLSILPADLVNDELLERKSKIVNWLKTSEKLKFFNDNERKLLITLGIIYLTI
jgi:hypothetical protein